MKSNRHILPLVLLLLTLSSASMATAQSNVARKQTRKGNREYKKEHYDKAEVNYRRALHDDSTAYRAHYNLGNTLYRQKKYDQAANHYNKALELAGPDEKNRSRILHNLGNSNLMDGLSKDNRAEGLQQFQQAVNSYREALKLDPKNNNTRYNLSYAQKLLQQAQQQQQQQGGGQDQNKDSKDQQGNNGQGQNKEQNKNSKDQQGDNEQDQQKKQQGQNDSKSRQDQQKRQQQEKMQKLQDAERLLEAVKNNEKNTLKENAKHVEAATSGRIEKDW